jgi:hypothetical protein
MFVPIYCGGVLATAVRFGSGWICTRCKQNVKVVPVLAQRV